MERYDRTFLHRERDVEDLNIGKNFLIAEKEKWKNCGPRVRILSQWIDVLNQLENVTYRFTMLSF